MANRKPFSYPRFRAFDGKGKPLEGGTAEFFDAGTTNNRTVYSDPGLTVAAPNPVTLNARGEPESGGGTPIDIYVDGNPYKIVLKDSDDNTVWTIDNYIVDIEGISEPQGPIHATDAGTDQFEGALSTDPATGQVFSVDFQSANTTTTPTFENTSGSLGALTIKTREGLSVWQGSIDGVHSLSYDGTDYIVLDPHIDQDNMPPEIVDSVSDLQSGSFSTAVDRIWLSGYYGVGTAGGGPLYRDSGDTTTADNNVTVYVDADGVRWKRPDERRLLSSWSGGSIQDALDALESGVSGLRAGEVYIPAPVGSAYDQSITISGENGGRLIGQGINTQITSSDSSHTLSITADDWDVSNFWFDHLGTGNFDAINITGDEVRVRNVDCDFAPRYSLFIGGVRTHVSDSDFQGGGTATIRADGIAAVFSNVICVIPADNQSHQCHVTGSSNQFHGLQLRQAKDGANALTVAGARNEGNVLISSNADSVKAFRFTSGAQYNNLSLNIELSSATNSLDAGTIEDNLNTIHIVSDYDGSGNNIIVDGSANALSGVVTSNQSGSVALVLNGDENTFNGTARASSDTGETGMTVTGSNNVITGAIRGDLELSGTSNNNIVVAEITGSITDNGTGNRVNGVTPFITLTDGDATPDVSQGDRFKTANSAATTITDFDTDKRDGREIFVLINDNNTTVDFTGSGLVGNGDSDWSPNTGDHMRCVYNAVSGVWYCAVEDSS